MVSTNKPPETWTQDPEERDLWHGENGVILNTAALEERTAYYEVVRLHHPNNISKTSMSAKLFA